jgi:hypothetical protein
MHWNQKQEQYKNKRPRDTKYITHTNEKKTQLRHIQEDKKNTYIKTENEYFVWIAPKTYKHNSEPRMINTTYNTRQTISNFTL